MQSIIHQIFITCYFYSNTTAKSRSHAFCFSTRVAQRRALIHL